MSDNREQVYADEFGTVHVANDSAHAVEAHEHVDSLVDGDNDMLTFVWDPEAGVFRGVAMWGTGNDDGCIFDIDEDTNRKLKAMHHALRVSNEQLDAEEADNGSLD